MSVDERSVGTSSSPQNKEKLMKRQLVHTASPYEVSESFARAVVVGDWVFVSNSTGYDYDTQVLPDTLEGQTNGALDNVSRALAAAGASLDDVVRRQVISPHPEHTAEVMDIVAERFRGASPTNTVLCSPLADPRYLVEVEVVAYRGSGSAETETIRI
jgi:enamine deaminase RidA (YjgF/YER057c/UK114 family)